MREGEKIKKSANVIKNRDALFSPWPSSPSLFNSLLYVSMHGWRMEGGMGGREREIDQFISVESGIMRTERERKR